MATHANISAGLFALALCGDQSCGRWKLGVVQKGLMPPKNKKGERKGNAHKAVLKAGRFPVTWGLLREAPEPT